MRHRGIAVIVAAVLDQRCRRRLDACTEHARAETDLLLRDAEREMRVGQQLTDFAGRGKRLRNLCLLYTSRCV